MATTQNYYKVKHGLEVPSQDTVQVTASTLPTIRPSLSLDFANSRSVDERITFTRSTNATYYDANGILRTAYADQPRIDFDPATGACKGLLIEEQRTNLVATSDVLNSSNFTPANSIIEPYFGVDPMGTMRASKITALNTDPYLMFTFTVTANVTYTASLWIKGIGSSIGTQAWIWAWAAGSASGASQFPLSTTVLTDKWQRITCAFTFTSTGTMILRLEPGDANWTPAVQAGWEYLVYGLQIEEGAFATSYIPTTPAFSSRASSATYYDSTGVLRIAGTNQPRYGYGYDSVTGKWVSQGLVLEAAATNLINRSTLGNIGTDWQQYNTTVLTSNYSTAPDGSFTAGRITCSSAGTVRVGTASLTNGTIYAASLWVKSNTGSNYTLTLQVGDGNAVSVTVTPTWQRFFGFATPNVTGYNFIDIEAIQAGADISVWGAQLETGYVTTSYIPTISGSVTRAADVSTSAATTRAKDSAQITGVNFLSWYNQAESTVYAEADVLGVSTNGAVGHNIYCFGSSGNEAIVVGVANTSAVVSAGRSAVGGIQLASAINNVPFKVGHSFNRSTTYHYATTNGTAVQGPFGYGVPYQDSLTIGDSPNVPNRILSGHIKKLTCYGKAVTSAQLQAITK